MSYRLLVTAIHPDETINFVLRDGDMGDLMRSKDVFCGFLKELCSHNFSTVNITNWLDANYPDRIATTSIEIKFWPTDEARAEWIKVYADRHVEVDLLKGQVSSPLWSAMMDGSTP